MKPDSPYPDSTMLPTEVGERVRFIAYGGAVRQYHVDHVGTVVSFNRNGHPVVMLDVPPMANSAADCVVDRYDCARVIDTAHNLKLAS